MTTATFHDTYFGPVTVTLKKIGKGWLWVARKCVSPGYKPVPSAERAIAIAQRDRRFSEVVAA